MVKHFANNVAMWLIGSFVKLLRILQNEKLPIYSVFVYACHFIHVHAYDIIRTKHNFMATHALVVLYKTLNFEK